MTLISLLFIISCFSFYLISILFKLYHSHLLFLMLELVSCIFLCNVGEIKQQTFHLFVVLLCHVLQNNIRFKSGERFWFLRTFFKPNEKFSLQTKVSHACPAIFLYYMNLILFFFNLSGMQRQCSQFCCRKNKEHLYFE